MPYHDEAHVLKLLARGDEGAFKLIYERYAIAVVRAGLKYLQSPRLAEDLVQEVFSQVWVERERFAAVENFESYLFICTRNRALHYLKKIAREEAAKKEYLNLKAIADNNIDDYIKDKELAELVRQAVDALPPQRKRVYQMVREEGLSHKDIAERLHLTTLTVSTHMVHALKFIRLSLARHIATLYIIVLGD